MKLLILLFITLKVFADSLTVVSVGEAQTIKEKLQVEKLIINDTVTPAQKEIFSNVETIILNDFRFYSHLVNPTLKRALASDISEVKYEVYKSLGINYLIRLKLTKSDLNFVLEYKAFNIINNEEIASGLEFITSGNIRDVGHKVSSEVFRKAFGKDPIFQDKIVFVSDRGSKKGIKNLYIMDFDGARVRQLTRHNGIVISPAVSHDGTKVLYSLINEATRRKKNINLRLLDLTTNKDTLLSSKRGINSGAIFTKDGKSIILTMSHQGNAEIYKMELGSRKTTRLTRNGAPDVDPSITSDGSLMTFLSARPGKPMVYTMDPSGLEKNVKRISYVGQFNATPRFSPDGKEIVFSSWLDNRFDLFKINSDGTGLGRLTKDFGSNEDAVYSKDGQFIVFTSQRVISRKKALQNVYIMDREGKIIGALTKNFGKCISPRWLKLL